MSERLEEIKQIKKICNGSMTGYSIEQIDNKALFLVRTHVGWLIEQAERVEELEEGNNKFMKWWKDEARLNNKLMEERERHRDAIKRIKDNMPLEFKHDSEYESKKNVIRLINIQSEVDKALEGDK